MKSATLSVCPALLLLFVTFFSGPSHAGIYKYTDDDGVTHYSNSLDTVPAQHRSDIEMEREIRDPWEPPAEEASGKTLPETNGVENDFQEKSKEIESRRKDLNKQRRLLLEERKKLDSDRKSAKSESEVREYNEKVENLNKKMESHENARKQLEAEIDDFNKAAGSAPGKE